MTELAGKLTADAKRRPVEFEKDRVADGVLTRVGLKWQVEMGRASGRVVDEQVERASRLS